MIPITPPLNRLFMMPVACGQEVLQESSPVHKTEQTDHHKNDPCKRFDVRQNMVADPEVFIGKQHQQKTGCNDGTALESSAGCQVAVDKDVNPQMAGNNNFEPERTMPLDANRMERLPTSCLLL